MAVLSTPSRELNPDEFLELGLEMLGYDRSRRSKSSKKRNVDRFTSQYGSAHVVVAKLWQDLLTTDDQNARVDPNKADACNFLVALYFLRKYPTEDDLEATFQMCVKTARKWCWYYAEKIQALKATTIVWPDQWKDGHIIPNESETFLVSVDGVHCRVNEPKHPEYPKNHKMYSHKFKTAGLNYEVAISLWESKVVWVNGPFEASVGDLTIFRKTNGLESIIPAGCLATADQGYRGDSDKLSLPCSLDPEGVRRFKSRARARQESFNARLKQFKCLSQAFRHHLSKHKCCFEAVAVICQYQLDNGFELYDV